MNNYAFAIKSFEIRKKFINGKKAEQSEYKGINEMTYLNVGLAYYNMNFKEKAIINLQNALDIFNEHYDRLSNDYLKFLYYLALCYFQKNEFGISVEYFQKAVEAAQRMKAQAMLFYIDSVDKLVFIYSTNGDLKTLKKYETLKAF